MSTTLKRVSLSAVAVAAALASAGVQAQSVEVRVVGQIVPAACGFNLAGGGIVDYGNIPAGTLNHTEYTVLPVKHIDFSITCDARVKVGFRALDNRAYSQVPGIVFGLFGVAPQYLNDAYNFGLGVVDGANVGGYAMQLHASSSTADGADVQPIFSRDKITWDVNSGGGVPHDGVTLSWSDRSSSPATPIAAATFSSELTIQAKLNRGNALPLTGPVPLDGLATLELVYL